MDINKERLKNRLNVKFQPLKLHPSSMKRLAIVDRTAEKGGKEEPGKDKERSLLDSSRNRSITHMRLPSLQKKSNTVKLIDQKTEEIINMREMRQRIKSIKVLPTIKVESKQPINDTITYLMKNEILNIPKIVAILQKSQSEEFLYMKVIGIYEFQVCNEQEKGANYITVSKNGMVRDGEMTPLDKLIYEYQIFSKLKKNHFFRYYLAIKFMNKWHKGSKMIKFVENKFKIKKLLFLDNEKLLGWRVQLKNMLFIADKGGHVNSGWVNRVAKEIQSNKDEVEAKLLHISVKVLDKFQLPISESFQLMNKVLSNLLNLNINFQKKIRIEKELELIYKLGLMLEFNELQAIAFYLINHIELLSLKFQEKNNQYINNVLIPLQQLDMNHPNYISDKEKILLATVIKEQINFKMMINQFDEVVIEPSMRSILGKIKADIKEFVAKVENFNYKIIRVPKFDYVVKNVVRPHETEQMIGPTGKETNLKEYIYSINAYYQKMKELQTNTEKINDTIQRRIKLIDPFFRIYHNYKDKLANKVFINFTYEMISQEIDEVQEKILTCQNKMHDGEYFFLGYLSQLEIKEQITVFLKEYKEQVLAIVPSKIKENKEIFISNMNKHLQVLRIVIKNADDFIKVYSECSELDDKILIYASDLSEIQKLQDLYLRIKKIESLSLVEEKGLLNELRMKSKNYKETKQSSYLLYKKQVDTYMKDLISKVEAIVPNELYYELSATPVLVYNKCHENNIKLSQLSEELKHLNVLEGFFDMKITLIPKLETLLVKFESLQEIWQIYKEYEVEKEAYFYVNIMKIEVLPLIKKYESYMRKCQRYNKDPDYYKLAQHLLQKIPLLLNSFYLIQDLHNPILRSLDYDQLSQLFQRQRKVGRPTKDFTLSIVYEHNLSNLREQVLEINFKSHKQQEIQRLLKEYDLWWKSIKLEGEYLDEYPLIIIFNDNDQLRKEIQEYSTILLNIINHKYGAFARKECNNNLRNINSLAGLLELAINHQEKFLSLFPILTSKYAEKQLPSQAKKFMSIIHKSMKNVKWLIKPTQNLNQNTKLMLNNHIKQFDAISKTLAHFLEKKRVKFQRFYFLQDDELLEVLVGIGAENTIFRMFDGIKGWLADKEGVKYGVEGIGGENLVLRGWSYKNQQPQIIFKSLQDSIRTNLNSIVRNILNSYENQLKELKNLYPNMPWMCIYTVQLILFTKQLQINCFQNNVNIALQASLIQQNIAVSVANPLENSNYITLQLFLLHFTEELRHENVNTVFDFKWHSFLRYYYEKDSVVMKIMGSEHHWGGEYQGLWNLMINTSDIRRAHTSILSNIKYGNGVLLQGPSGTGKTESLKELGRCMAKYCVIFNCSSEVNIRTLQKLLSGLCYTGSWLCLDEINRLTAEIMSVVANQINSIKNAVVQGKEIFSFMGKDMRLKKGVGIFSTMNPIYLKRAKLTESLKSYFRIISVNVPDYEKILEVMLYSLGISSSSIYAHKISVMFKNLSIQLSLRSQYDFGLRAMKFFIFNLSLIRKTLKNEEESIIQALCKTFYSRLEADDKVSFSKIINDMFGKKIEEKQTNYKVAMMKEAPQTGIIVLGPTSSKTTLINEYIGLFAAQDRVVEVFNPNSLELKYFLGQSILGRWQQGIVEKMARGSFENSKKNYVLILDCKLKSQTIQNFNTLLDDSKLLSLSNGTRLKIHNNFKIILETPDLEMTSPATITRCNVIYVSQNDISKSELIKKILPIFTIPDTHEKMTDALSRFSITDIQKIIKICRLLFVKKLSEHDKLTESESIGFQRCLFYTIQLLGLSQKVKNLMHKDNSVLGKKSIFNFYLSFSKYREGEFLQFQLNVKELRYLSEIYIPTVRNKFYEYVNSKSYQNCEYVLWKGERMSGKSTCIHFSLQEIFKSRPEHKNMLKMAVNPETTSKSISAFIEEKMNIKEEKDQTSKKLLVYVDDIHLGSEEVFEFFRFATEYQRIFSYKSKEIVGMTKHTFIADSNNRFNKEFKARFSRHFAELSLPPCEETSIKAIYADLIRNVVMQTKTSNDFKSTYELEVQRVASFFNEYLKFNNKSYSESYVQGSQAKQELEYLGFCDVLPVIKNYRILNDAFCKQATDFVGFSLSQLRSQQVEHRRSIRQIDFIKLAYQEVFKHKYQHQYDKNLKSATGHPLEVVKYSGVVKGNIVPISNWQEYKTNIIGRLSSNYYLSEFMLLEILKILRILEWNGGNYYLIGQPGVGRRTLLKISSSLAQKECIESLPGDQKRISEWYFSILKSSFQRKKETTVVICLDNRPNLKLLSYLQKISNKHPIQELLSNQDCEYAYSEVNQFSEVNYDKYTRSYDEVIADFVFMASKKIQFLFYSGRQVVPQFMKNYHYTHQKTKSRLIEEVPSESILQISNQILEKNLHEQADKKGLTNLFLKIYNDLIALMRENENNQKYHFKYNSFYHFKIINRFIYNYRKLLEKAKEKEDILNRSILKVHEISQILERLKVEIKEMEPKVKDKTQKLLEVVPILEAKKKVSQEVKVVVLNEKREIQSKNAEIQEIMKEVEEKIQKAEPILQEANDSMLTLKRSQLSELRNNPNPHPLIKFTLENMVILLGENQSWQNIKKILSDPSLLTKLKNISPVQANIQKARRRIDENKDWTFDNVSKVSYGVRYMVRWINNIIKFYELKNSLDSEKMKVEEYKKELSSLEEKQQGKQRQLDIQQEQIRIIEDQYNFNKNQLISLQELININNRKFQNAELIKNHLHQEINNWYDSLNKYKSLKKNSEATAISITLFLQVFNTLHLQEQLKIDQQLREHFAKLSFSFDPNFDIFQYIKDSVMRKKYVEVEKNKYKEENRQVFALQYLTMEDSSNPKIIQTLYHFQDRPILLDPDNQAINWIQRQLAGEGQNGMKPTITKESFLSSVKSVESALREGNILILIIQDQLDQFTSDILNAKVTDASGSKIIQYNKNILHIHSNFRLLLCNKSRNPQLSNKLYIDYPILNFEITKNILTNMLLHELIVLENREIYSIRKQLELEKKQYEKIISEVEEQIIDSLISSKKTLIDDNDFINLLSENQAKRAALKENEADWRQKTTNIKKIYDSYADITESIGQIYISLKHVSKINPILSWNSEIFVQYFVQAVRLSISAPLFDEDDDDAPSPKMLKRSNFEFDHYSIGLGNSRPTSALSFVSGVTSKVAQQQRKDDFQEQHPTSKYAFESLINTKEMQVDEKQIGTMSADRQKKIRSKFIEFVKFAFTEEERVIWGLVLCFANLPFKDIKALIEIKPKRNKLKDYLQANELSDKIKNLASQNERLQEELHKIFTQANPFARLQELTELEILLLCKLLFPSQFSRLCKVLIRSKGLDEILNYSEIKTVHWFQRSDNVHPILLLMGEDPINRISDYLTERKYKNVILVPMGQGQNKLAQAVLQKESRKENLVIIHNLQISENFLSFLSKMLQQFQIKPPHENFRLILISTIFENLNQEITSYCHKYLIQQPLGIKNQMQYLREIATVPLLHPYHKKLGFVITYLHAIINNLSKYKPYGWNLKYEFHTTDFLNSLQTLKEVAESTLSLQHYECNIDIQEEKAKLSHDQIDFKALKYMIGEIGYIGKLADDIDRAKMTILINQFLNPDLFTPNHQNGLGIKTIKFSHLDADNMDQMIERINETDATIFGLHPSIKPVSEHSHTILEKIACIYNQNSSGTIDSKEAYLKPIQPISHKFQYVNKEIAKYNSDLEKIKMEGASEHLMRNMGNGRLLSTITPVSKIFNLKAFSNPREFFISIKKDLAHKSNVIYEKVELVWSLVPKDTLTGVFGISSIKLEGGCIDENRLQDGVEQRDLTLYVQAVIRKKQKETKKLVSIPLYLEQERQGQINSYGDNTNLLVLVKIEAAFPQEFWILRSTAFIVM